MERGARTIMVTSAVEQEGKSTTVANLAVAFARGGARVTLVDLDLRRPFLHRFFETDPVPGVTDVALGRSDLGGAVVHVGIGRCDSGDSSDSTEPPSRNGGGASPTMFDLLTSGSVPPDPGEFIASRALSSILDEVAADSDLVFVDAPPLLHLGDAVALSAKVDALIVVVGLKVATYSMLRELRRVLEKCGATKLGFVLADADEEEGYDYGRGYYYAKGTKSTEGQFARRA
jgi:succinoglycan biosynthesis transport protein ExoP